MSSLFKKKDALNQTNYRPVGILIALSKISKGVPQGSILGPLIFNIFMNDIFYVIKNANLFNYAEDDAVSVNGKALSMASRLLQRPRSLSIGSLRMQWKLIPEKLLWIYFMGILFKGNKQLSDFNVSVDGRCWILHIYDCSRHLYWWEFDFQYTYK